MKYKLVQNVEGKLMATEFTDENLHMAMEVRGFEFLGVETNSRLRKELLGEPRFSKLCGPMWDGVDSKKEGIVRYEDQEAYNILSQ